MKKINIGIERVAECEDDDRYYCPICQCWGTSGNGTCGDAQHEIYDVEDIDIKTGDIWIN